MTIGAYMFLQSFIDMLPCDIMGGTEYKQYKKSGTHFPMAFRMKYLSRLALSCRHPMDAGNLLMLLSSTLYGDLTFGRFFTVACFGSYLIIGTFYETADIKKIAEKEYKTYCEAIPNNFIPSLKVLMMSEKDLDTIRKKMTPH